MIGIKIKMPKNCQNCPLCKNQEDFISYYFSCGLNGKVVDSYMDGEKRPNFCPLIQL
ncbi:MAG: hypothetical protein NC222_06355 [Staphylococcus sp.]|nr:hypothetical protein [Staphylococcus sp.]